MLLGLLQELIDLSSHLERWSRTRVLQTTLFPATAGAWVWGACGWDFDSRVRLAPEGWLQTDQTQERGLDCQRPNPQLKNSLWSGGSLSVG